MHPEERQTWRLIRTWLYLMLLISALPATAYLFNSVDRWLIGTATKPIENTPVHGASVKVQTFAEILAAPNGDRVANAWAAGATMAAESLVTDNTLHAQAKAAWPAEPLPVLTPENRPTLLPNRVITATATIPITPAAPRFTVTQPLVNVRSGPSMDHPIIQQVGAGHTFSLLGRWEDWWQVDTRYTPGWVYAPLGKVDGDLSTMTTVTNFPPAPTAPPATPTGTPPPTSAPSGAYPFAVEQVTRHPEANTVTVYAYVHETGQALNGYYLWITHNGAAYRSGPSSALIAGTTKPADPASPNNVAYNVKIDFPTFIYPALDMTGLWSVLLVDGNNQALSAPTIVTITPADTQRELYLRYRKGP